MISNWLSAKSSYATISSDTLLSSSSITHNHGDKHHRTMETGPESVSQVRRAPHQELALADPVFQCLGFLQPLSAGPLPFWESPQWQNLPSLKITRSGSSNRKTTATGSSSLLVQFWSHTAWLTTDLYRNLFPMPSQLDKQAACHSSLGWPSYGMPSGPALSMVVWPRHWSPPTKGISEFQKP